MIPHYITQADVENNTIWLWSVTQNRWVERSPSNPDWYRLYDVYLSPTGHFNYYGAWWYMGTVAPRPLRTQEIDQ